MIVRIQIDRRTRALVQKLKKLDRDFNSTNPRIQQAYKGMGMAGLKELETRYASASAGDGTWKPLAASTLKQKVKRQGILRVTDQLFASLRPGAAGNVLRTVRDGVDYGTKNPKAKFHQFASRIPVRKIVVPPSDSVRRQMRGIIQAAIRDVLKNTLTGQQSLLRAA